ncbi:hypothetical protein ACFW1A_29860 [Kitasatospora sp. NPDC058965]|uniref:hypothetical protein n=1 Tax=Kitasatospora sp. NPDC058965 TaxID=3346682 RepID=UPI00367F8562
MSDAIPSYGFTSARRGYAPEQVDHALAALTAQRDEAWQRLSRLGAQVRDLEIALANAKQAAAEAPEPDYATLSEQAGDLMAIADNEARQIRDKAERFAEDTRDETYQAGQELQGKAAEYAATTRADADQAARRTDERTRAEAEKLRGEADRDARAIRDGATAEAAAVRVRAAEAGERAEAKLAELRRDADERFAADEAAAQAEDTKLSTVAERRLKEAEQHRETTLGLIKQIEVDAQAQADQQVERARREAERIGTASAEERAEFDKRLSTVQTHLDHIKGTLASLTGKAVGMIEPGEAPPAALTPPPAPAGQQPAAPAPAAHQEAAPAPAGQEAAPPQDAPPRDPAAPAASEPDAAAAPATTGDEPTAVLRLPADLRETARPAAPTGPVDPRTALRAAGAGQPPIPPRPATPPPSAAPAKPQEPPAKPQDPPAAPQDAAPARPQDAAAPAGAEAETAVIPKIVIIDDGTTLDTLPNTVGRRRT